MLVIGVYDVILLQWLKVKSLLAERLAELLIRVVQIQELLLNDFDVLRIFEIDLHVFIIIVFLLLVLLLMLALWGASILILFIIVFIVNDIS